MLRALALVLLVVAGLAVAGLAAPGAAQEPTASAQTEWTEAIARASALKAEPEALTEDLERVRDRLQRLRSAAIEAEAAGAGRLADANARLTALGPPPAEGATESAEVAARRAQINAEIAAAQVPVVEAQDFQRQADALIRDINHVVRARFSAELRSRGPSPLRPTNWVQTAQSLKANLDLRRDEVAAVLADDRSRAALLQRIPFDLMLAIVGIAITFSLRVRLVRWVEDQLGRANSPKTVALLVNLRNFSRLIVPAVGVGLLFAALDPADLLDVTARSKLFVLPDFALAVIAASWLGNSVFAPELPAYRLASVNDADAASAARLSVGLGAVLGANLFLRRYVTNFDMSPAAAVTLVFPLFLIGGLLLWRFSRILRRLRRDIRLRDRGVPVGERAGAITMSALAFIERLVWIVAFAAPALAAAGYLAAASYLLYSTILTLALFAAGVSIFFLVITTLGVLVIREAEPGRDPNADGLAPVLVAALLTLAAIPFLALIWGARTSDIADVGFMLRDGVTYGGMRISVGTLVTFTLVFGLIYGLSRVLRSVLRNTVLPRTRMDAGGKNAVLAGVSYVGFFIAGIVAVSSTGIDLTNLAVVAGALSVGIGFGLQNIVSNFVSGIILLVERPIKEGDWIEVGGFAGYVRGISVRSTEIETFDRASVILPNSDLVAGTVLNRTHSGMSGRIQVPVSVAMESDPRLVERVLVEIAETHPLVLTDPSPRVLLLEVGPDALLFEIRCWLRDVNFSLSARSDINFEILEKLEKIGVKLQPFARAAPVAPPPPEAAPPAAVAPPDDDAPPAKPA